MLRLYSSGVYVDRICQKIWERIYRMPFLCCTETHLQSFHLKIINITISCNTYLRNIKI